MKLKNTKTFLNTKLIFINTGLFGYLGDCLYICNVSQLRNTDTNLKHKYMSNKINAQEGSQVVTAAASQAKSLMSERINEVLDQKMRKAILEKVEDSTLVMMVDRNMKDCGWSAKYEDNYGQRYRMNLHWWHKDDSKDGDIMMTITIEHKVGARYQQVGDPIEVKSDYKKNAGIVLSAIVTAADLAVDKGTTEDVTRIDSEWGQMMDLTLITKKEGNHTMAMVRANYGGEITESGWCTVYDTMTREEMALEVMLTCWVNSEVIGAGSK